MALAVRYLLRTSVFVWVLGFQSIFAEDIVEPKVNSISPNEGSYMGATRLYIYGQGFSSSGNFGAEGEDPNLGNKVYLLSDLESVECDVENDASHETMIVCYTRPMRRDHHYFVKVFVDGKEVPFQTNCNNNGRHWRCRFIPRWYKTPYIRALHVHEEGAQYPLQTSYAPGALITAWGRIFTQIYGSNNQTNENGKTVSIRRTYVGGQTCALLKEPDVFYDLRLTSGDEGVLDCKPKSTFVGPHNFSFILEDDFGRAEVPTALAKVNGKNKVYHFQTYAEITRVTPQVGSLEGGTRVVVEGRHFDDTTEPVSIYIGRTPCEVIPGTLTTTRVECIAGSPASGANYYTGSRGIMVEMWNETTASNDVARTFNSSLSNYQGSSVIDSTMYKWNNSISNSVAKYTGVFVAPQTDSYMFMIAGDDYVSLYLNCDGSKENLTKVAWTLFNVATYHYDYQKSDWIHLNEGQECYFESLMVEYGGELYMYVGVQRATTTLTASQSVDAKNEVQYVDFHAKIYDEKQVVNFTNYASQTGVAEVQRVTVRHSCIDTSSCQSVNFRLGCQNVWTTLIPADASQSVVLSALKGINELSDENIAVTVEKGSGQMTYTVEFGKKRGDYSDLTFVKFPAGVQGLQITVEEVTKGIPEKKTFKLRLGGRATPAISKSFDIEELQTALDATRDAICPSFILPDERKSTVLTTNDFEKDKHGDEWGKRKQDTEPFCGKTSNLNMEFLYNAGRTADNEHERHKAFAAHEYRWVCLAHRGLLAEHIHISGTFIGENTLSGTHSFTNPLAQHKTEWKYSCFDIMEVISSQSGFAGTIEATISSIQFFRLDKYHNYYLDAITIGQNKVTEDIQGVIGMRTPPALANGKPVSQITVTKIENENAYEFEIATHDCGDKLPLIQMSTATELPVERTVTGTEQMVGTFDLTVGLNDGKYNVTDIPVEILSEDLEQRLESEVPGFGEAKVSRHGNCHARDYRIEWTSNGGDKPQMSVYTDGIAGASDIRATVATHQNGGVLHHPISGDMLRLAYDTPQVEVYINGYPSRCTGSCDFQTAESATPVVSGISPSSGNSLAGTVLTITGTNLEAVSGIATSVKVGGSECIVSTNTDSSISCTLSDGPLGTYDVSVNVGGKGLAKKETESVSLSFAISGSITSIDPTTGFISGGTLVTISGYGFSNNTVFNFASKPCDIISFNATTIQCYTPEASSLGSVSVKGVDGSESLGSTSFTYIAADAEISSIDPTTSTLNGGGTLTISGTNLDKDNGVVFIGSKECDISESTSTSIECLLPSLPRGVYDVKVRFDVAGFATNSGGTKQVTYDLKVNNVSPIIGSKTGGTEITIAGSGFTDVTSTKVKIGHSACFITSISANAIQCITGHMGKTVTVTNKVLGATYVWDSLVVRINVGDTVIWRWEFQGADGGWEYGAKVFTTETADSSEYDEIGFQSNPTKSKKGSFSYTFFKEGKYYISSGKVDHDRWGSIEMKQVIFVEPEQPQANVLSVQVAGFEADYSLESSSKRRKRSTCEEADLSSCPAPSVSVDADSFSIVTDSCYSSTVTSISQNKGYKDSEIIIQGTGFASSNCANKVIIGEGHPGKYECIVFSSTKKKIKCRPLPNENTLINAQYYFKVKVHNVGYSKMGIENDDLRKFALLPSFSNVSPAEGSVAGGTLLTIEGSGFSSDSVVMIGQYQCTVQNVSYFEIQCLTPSSSEKTVDVTITINGQHANCTGTCSFAYKTSLTPTITNVSPLTVDSNDAEFTLEGTSLSAPQDDLDIKIGEKNCDVSSVSSTSIVCTVSELPAGSHPLQVTVKDLGRAKITNGFGSVTSSPVVTSMTPVNGSKEGGTVITFVGNGFDCEDIEVKLGNKKCDVQPGMTNSKMLCITDAQSQNTRDVTVKGCGLTFTFSTTNQFRHDKDLTPEITSISPTTGEAGSTVVITGEKFQPSDMTVMIGEKSCMNIAGNDSYITCELDQHPGGEYSVSAVVGNLGNAMSDVSFNYSFTLMNMEPSRGSFAGGNILTLSGKGFGERASVTICDSACTVGNDVEGTNATYDQIKCRVPEMTGDASTDKNCDISISVDGKTIVGEDMYTYAADKTPQITKISPERGGTQGGTEVTITGTLFDSNSNNVHVTIGGVVCDVSLSSTTEITCTTNSRGKSLKADIKITIDGKGLALSNGIKFFYVDVWSSRWTWGGLDPPVKGDFIVVPTGQTLLLDVDTPVLKMILINGGELIFDEKDIHLQTENILITNGGLLQIGTEESPFEHKAIITLHGHLRSKELPIYGTKTIGVRNGTLDLHGKPVPITWTLLKETASAGSNTLKLKDAVTWKAGDKIVIASTGDRHSQRENEERIISSISGDNTVITLSEPLQYAHISATETFDGVVLETYGEVGLLTRNIVVEGSTHMEWSKDVIPACPEGFDTGEFKAQTCFQGRFGEEEGSDQFGAQIMIHHRAPGLDLARARIEYVELTNMGQAFRLGRYPIHFHLLGDVNFNNYVRGCAIHKSFNRAITIHNTHHLLIENNVVYNIMGGAVFIEDGIEHGNKIQYNLVVFCRQSTSLQNDDITPAAFWVTNPNNTLQHNHAAGGTHFGFWYRIHATPDGPSRDSSICQQLHPIEKFENNTVHSQGWFGLWVFQAYTPRGDGSCGSQDPTVVRYDGMLVWNCEKGAELVNVGAIQFHNFIMAHNEKAGIETKLIVDNQVKWGQVGTYDSFIIAHAAALTEGGSTARGIILPFTEGYEVNDTKFINFDNSNDAAIGVTSIDGTCSVLCGGWEARFARISYQNSPNKAAFRWEHEVILRDIDGSLTGAGKHSIVTPHNPSISSTDCSEIDGFDIGGFKGVVCDGSKKFHRVSWNNVSPTSLEAKNVSFTTSSGSSFIPFAKKRLTHKFGWMGTMMDGSTYRWTFENADHLTNISYAAEFYNFLEEDCVIVMHNLTQKPDKFAIADDNEDHAQTDMVTCDSHYHGDYYFNTEFLELYYIVSGRDRPSRRRKRDNRNSATEGAVNREVNFKVYRCFYEGCLPPPDPNSEPPVRERPTEFQIWHDTNYWKMNGDGEYVGTVEGDGATQIPPADQNIRIESGTWMVVKEDLNKMNELWIEGVLEIDWEDPNLEVTLSATHIMIMSGRLIIGWEDKIFRGFANIVLRGNHNTQDKVLNGGVVLGAKAIGVVGGLDLHGRERSPRKTHLASTLSQGDNTITVDGTPPTPDWKEGDEIAIATTSADPWETETFKIVSVSGNIITLNQSAKFNHLAKTFSYDITGSGPKSYDIKAEVSLLTRNIKVIGEDYSSLFSESFGARVLVAGAGQARGYARIENVEFYHTGQEGWIDNYDPRYSLAFLNSGENDVVKPSYVRRNTFHNGFNTAIGVFGASKLTLSDNVIHHTVGPGIRVEGTNISVLNNLVMLARTRSVYQDREEVDILKWKAAIETNLAIDPVLVENVVVGSERGGYRIDGHDCGPSAGMPKDWGWNTARATLHGIFMNKDGFSTCSHISKFKIHNAYDEGIYYQGSGSVIMSDILVTDSTFAITAIVYSPASSSHSFQDKTVTIANSTIVAVSQPNYCPTLPGDTDFLKNSALARGLRRDGATQLAKTGILWPVFISSQNAAPSKPFLGSMSYPAIGGRTNLNGVTFINFGDETCSKLNTAILTNLQVEDFLHPIYTSGLEFINTPEKSKIYFHRPSIGAINPSDCVDMECDGMKKALIVDTDGSLVGAPGSVFPQAEFEWGGDRRRGLGDYRIPKSLLTNLDGSRIPVEDIAPNKGILRANTSEAQCVSQEEWHGHKCTGYHHGILVIESLDADTETRRLSPVALLSNAYIDLNNGPQDHGWCAGYTCQERLSTFWTIVAFSETYEMHFSGTSPEKMRLRILKESADTKMVFRMFCKRPQRLDVYVNGSYVPPLNADDKVLLAPITPDQYHPTLNNDTGANYFDRDAQIIHITLGGDHIVEIYEANVVVITFNLPAVDPDEFFDNGRIVENLALFLNIPPNKIRIVNAVREGSRRQKRSVGSYRTTVEIGDAPAATSDSVETTTPSATTSSGESSMSREDLLRAASAIANSYQENTLGDALGTNVAAVTVADPRTAPVRNANLTNTTEGEISVTYSVPTGIRIVEQPSSGFIETKLSPALKVVGYDSNGNEIILGHIADQWQATVTIVSATHGDASLSENVAIFDTTDGHALFENLTMSHTGDYHLRIQITHPATMSDVTVDAETINIREEEVEVGPVSTIDPAIIAGAVIGGLLIIVLLIIFLVKGPLCKTSKSYKVTPTPPPQIEMNEKFHTKPEKDQQKVDSGEMTINNETLKEPRPNSVTDLKEGLNPYDRVGTPDSVAGNI